MRATARQQGNGQERRAVPRFKVSLSLELWIEDRPTTDPPRVYMTQDVSIKGFYFSSERSFEKGSSFKFRIPFPRELTGRDLELMTGTARYLRIEKRPDLRYGVAAVIEEAIALDEHLGKRS